MSTIEYAFGSADAPRGGLRRLTIHSSDRFEFVFQHHRNRRAWEGMLEPGTFERALALIREAKIPLPGPKRGLVPGEETSRVGLERGGAWERITVLEDDVRYIELVKLNSSILAPLDESLARMPPGMTSPIRDVHPV